MLYTHIYVIRQHQIKDQSLYLCQKFDLFSVYLNRELKVEKDVSAGKIILCLACYKNFNKFVRSDDSLNELSKTDDYQLTKCFPTLW
jgi:hypothetical protein